MQPKNRLPILNIIVVALGCLAFLYVLINVLFTKPVGKENKTLIQGYFANIQLQTRKGDTSYRLYLNEKEDYYIISAEWSGCFKYKSFLNDIRHNQSIVIAISNNAILRTPAVVLIQANNKDYIDQNCINKEIDNTKHNLPLLLLCVCGIICLLLYLKEKKRGKGLYKH
jgi:hypothetical protein